MIVSKKSIGLIVLLIVPCFAIAQNSVDSTTVKQDSIAIRTDSLCQQKAMCKCDTVRIDSCQRQLPTAAWTIFCPQSAKANMGY